MSDEVWAQLEDILKSVEGRRVIEDGRVKPYGYWISDRAALSGALWRLRERANWRDIEVSRGYGSGEIVRARLREWEALGIWEDMREILESQLDDGYELGWWSVKPKNPKYAAQRRDRASDVDGGVTKTEQRYRPPLPEAVPLVRKFNHRERALLRKLQKDPEHYFTIAEYSRTMRVGEPVARKDIGHLAEEWLLIGTRLGKAFRFRAPKDLAVRLQRFERMVSNEA